MNEDKYDVKHYGDQGGCFPLKLISLVNWPGRKTPHPKGFLVAIHFSGINAVHTIDIIFPQLLSQLSSKFSQR